MAAPERFAEWMSEYQHRDPHTKELTPYRYHPRSDVASKKLARLVLADVYAAIPGLQSRAARGEAGFGVCLRFAFENSEKEKALDLAVGIPAQVPFALSDDTMPEVKSLARLFIGIEAKATMTKHVGAKPRLWDELSSSHQIVHAGDQQAIACGITVVNIADRFASPTRNLQLGQPLVWTKHKQPHAVEDLLTFLHRLPIRSEIGQVGFDAYCNVVVNCDNVGPCTIWTDPPAPQPGDQDEYGAFIARIASLFARRFP